MGLRGPKPRSTDQLRKMGSREVYNRKLRPVEIFDPPSDFWRKRTFDEWWAYMSSMLKRKQVLAEEDMSELVLLCKWLVILGDLDGQEMQEKDEKKRKKPGRPKKIKVINPQFVKATEMVDRLTGRFGMTPASRASIRPTTYASDSDKIDKKKFFA